MQCGSRVINMPKNVKTPSCANTTGERNRTARYGDERFVPSRVPNTHTDRKTLGVAILLAWAGLVVLGVAAAYAAGGPVAALLTLGVALLSSGAGVAQTDAVDALRVRHALRRNAGRTDERGE